MMPILAAFGAIKIYAYGVFLFVGLFLSLYFWWKMGRDEHWDEIELFDGFFLALIIYLFSGRLGYVLTHLNDLDSLYRALALLSYPGINGVMGVVCTLSFAVLFARQRGWHAWKVLDVSVVALSIALVFGSVAHILNAGPSWLAGVWMFLWSLVTFALVSRVRKNFRFYAWYKGEASVAQEGLATLLFVLQAGVYYVMIGWLQAPIAKFWIVPVEFISGLALMGISLALIYARTGRKVNLLQWWRKRG